MVGKNTPGNLADLVLKEAQSIRISGENYLLFDAKVQGNLFQDFMKLYPNAGKRNTDLAKRLFRDKNLELNYSFIFDKDMKLAYIFNPGFVQYDSDSEQIIFHSAEEVLLDYISKQGGELRPVEGPQRPPIIIPNNPWLPGDVALYSMPEPRDDVHYKYGISTPENTSNGDYLIDDEDYLIDLILDEDYLMDLNLGEDEQDKKDKDNDSKKK